MERKMFCFQCEQTAGCTGCTGNAGVCGKSADVAKLQDELTGALDTKSSLGVLQAVQTLNDRYHTTVVIITHNAAISGMADRIIQIKDGKIQSNEVNANKVSPMELVL